MDELYRIHNAFSCPNNGDDGVFEVVDHSRSPVENIRGSCYDHQAILHHHHHHHHHEILLESSSSSDISDLLKAQIANHPLFPNLLSAHVDCKKVGAPPEMASLLEEISKESHPIISPTEIGADPELDKFMEAYCEALRRYKKELLKPFDEATTFLNNIESQFHYLCSEHTASSSLNSANYHSDEANDTSEEDLSCGEEVEVAESEESCVVAAQADNELKEMLMRKYSGYLSTLRKEFLKKRKKGKLPKDARMALMDWWNSHYRWPYPTEEEKNKLSEMTGLDQKQINNWFINQRKRHWKPSEDMRFALMQGVGAGAGAGAGAGNISSSPFLFDVAGGNASFGT